MLYDRGMQILQAKEVRYGAPVMRELERICLLKCVDRQWMDHIDNMDQLRQGIALRGYGQKDPVVEYRIEGFDMFDQMVDSIRESSVKMLLTIELRAAGSAPKREQVAKPTGEGFVPGNGAPGVKRSPKGQPVRVVKIGRNDPCPCGSGLKFKKCTCAQYHPTGNNRKDKPSRHGSAVAERSFRINSEGVDFTMIAPEKLLEAAKALEPQLQEWRRTLHRHPEVGFDLPQTKALVKKALTEMGYTPQDCGKCGVIALAGGKRPGKVILLRGDMDALPLQEESGEEFSSELPGKMHGCGHDMHTAMVLGAAKLLKEHEDEIEGTVKLEFQPAEEIFQGSLDMINSGLLENPKVDAAVMFHVLAGMSLPAGMVLVPGGGITMASCEQYHIVVHGKGGHGSMPNACIDPITAAAHIHIALQEINSRELDPAGFGVFTTGRFEAGKASNVIPDTADMWGTIRTVDPEQKVSALIHQRMTEIAQGVATAYRCTAEVEFSDYCPCMVVDTPLASNALTYMTELLGKGAMDMTPLTGGKPGGGSEDFAFVSHEVPTVSMFLAAGNAKEGYTYGQHHPKVRFDDSILYRGTAAYTYMALRWLAEHQ